MQAAPATTPVAAPATEEAPAESGFVARSPMVGTFYRAPNPESPDFVKVGDTVKVGQTLCIIEAMKLLNEIESEQAGVIKQILCENGQGVEFDQPLFIIA
jgi:acetyl-CoA carboxylase biotin carboxyl carrier protein